MGMHYMAVTCTYICTLDDVFDVILYVGLTPCFTHGFTHTALLDLCLTVRRELSGEELLGMCGGMCVRCGSWFMVRAQWEEHVHDGHGVVIELVVRRLIPGTLWSKVVEPLSMAYGTPPCQCPCEH